MQLNPDEMEAVNNKRDVIKKHFLNGVRYCNDCGGTGLDAFKANDGSYSWDGVSFCDTCKGVGYLKWKETLLEKLCPTCQGTGVCKNSNKVCPSCDKKGVVDWVRYIRLGGKKGVSKNKTKAEESKVF